MKDIVIRQRVGARVRAAMSDAGVTQERLAGVLGISQPQLSKRLAGLIGFDAVELQKAADLLAVPVADLIQEPERAA